MHTEPTTERTIQKAITYICQLEDGLDFVIKNTSEQSDNKEMLIVLKEFSKHKAECLEQQLTKVFKVDA